MSEQFTLYEWVKATPEQFDLSSEYEQHIKSKAEELIGLCMQHGIPASFVFNTGADVEGTKVVTIHNMPSAEKTSAEVLLGVAAADVELWGSIRNIMASAYERTMRIAKPTR